MFPEIVWTILGLLMLAGVLCFIVWVMLRSLGRSDDPPKLIVRWLITLLAAGTLAWALFGWGPNYGSAFAVPFLCVLLGVVLSATWAPSLASLLARPITSLFDGGIADAKPQPLYSVAEAKRKRGRTLEALQELQRQLEQFPNDFTCQLMVADIQANDLKNQEAAQATIARLCQQEGHPASAIADALNQLADWQLKLTQDIEGARQTLQEIIQRFPESPWSYAAHQRLAHLADPDQVLARFEPQSVAMPQPEAGDRPLGGPGPPPPEASPADEAQRLVQHLEAFPDDNEVREKLAALYVRHYQRLDLAAAELEQLLAQPNAPGRKRAHWLNLLADWQIEFGRDQEAARQTLQRIVDLFPDHSAGAMAQQRMQHLERELKKADQPASVKMGTYEQDMGLRRGPPKRGGPPGW
jgi:tetratricopeptide (TPR) repeat protein